jgi:hypothetical protein
MTTHIWDSFRKLILVGVKNTVINGSLALLQQLFQVIGQPTGIAGTGLSLITQVRPVTANFFNLSASIISAIRVVHSAFTFSPF